MFGPAGSPKTSNPRLNVDKTSTRGGSCSEAIDRPRCRERSCSPLQGDTASDLRKGVLPGKRSGTYATSYRKARQISIYLSILPVVACATVPYNVQVPLGVSPTLPLPPPRAARLSRSSNSPRATKTQAPRCNPATALPHKFDQPIVRVVERSDSVSVKTWGGR